MKPKNMQLTLLLACALCFLPGIHLVTAGEANSPTTITPPEDLGYDVFEGKTNKIARVYAVTPTHLQVLHEGGKSGRKIPRQELPPELAAQYPYNAAKAAGYQQQQMDIAARQIAAQRTVMEESARRRDKELADQVARLRTQSARLHADLNIAKTLPGKRKRAAETTNTLRELQSVQHQIARLEDQLTALRASRNTTP